MNKTNLKSFFLDSCVGKVITWSSSAEYPTLTLQDQETPNDFWPFSIRLLLQFKSLFSNLSVMNSQTAQERG